MPSGQEVPPGNHPAESQRGLDATNAHTPQGFSQPHGNTLTDRHRGRRACGYSTQGVLPGTTSFRYVQYQPTAFKSVCGNHSGGHQCEAGNPPAQNEYVGHFLQAGHCGGRSGVKLSPSQGLFCSTGKHLPKDSHPGVWVSLCTVVSKLATIP